MSEVYIYSDGSSRGNPGPGGYGTILTFTDKDGIVHEKELSGGFKNTTNNRMELLGVIEGLKQLTRPCEVVITSDSKYVTDAFNQHWVDGWQKANFRRGSKNEVKNIDLWEQLIKLVKSHNKVTFVWIKGHNGHEYNERCDKLATTAADSEQLLDDNF